MRRIFLCWHLFFGRRALRNPSQWLIRSLVGRDKDLPSRSILVLNEAAMIGPFYSAAYAALRSSVANKSVKPVSLFLEQLELERFSGASYEQSLKTYLQAKYSNEPIGVIVAFGFGALDLILRLQKDLWPGVPVVFVMVDEAACGN